ncbi:Phage-related protein [Chlamydia trachomatis]|nr:Phage-related protein [Chlamydia trachomatis]CRH89764.1 Phage-related protein [Chlamydia trachomatis]
MSGGIDLGDAWINVVPSFKGMGKSIAAEVSGLEQTVNSSAKGWGSTIASHLGGAFKTVGALAGISLTAAAGFIASYTGEAIRASDATDKFKSTLDFAGLDSSAISALTKSTQAYADKTVYDLSDIQNITAQLASNGVAGFDKLAEAAGNLNAVAGGNKETFKSVGQVITQTAGAGKLMTENWRQLTDAIPGAAGPLKQALLDAGAYTGDFQKAMENGEITADEFNQAITSLGFQEAAEQAATSTSTFEGAWGNFEAAITGGLVKIIEPLKGPVLDAFNSFTDKVGGVFDWVSEKVSKFSSGDGLGDMSGIFAGLGPVIGGLAGALGPLLSSIPGLSGVFGSLTGPVGVVIGLFAQMIANSSALQGALGTVFQVIGQVMSVAAPILGQIMTIIGELLGQIGDQLAPVIEQIATVIGDVLIAVLPMLTPILSTIGSLLSTLIPVAGQIISVVAQVVAAIAPLIVQLASALIPIIAALLPVVQTVFSAVASIISSVMGIVEGIIKTVTSVIKGDWAGAWEGIKQVFSGVWDLIVSIVTGQIALVKSVILAGINLVKSMWSNTWNTVTNLVTNAWEGIKYAVSNGISGMMGFITSIPNKILGAFASAKSWLVDSGRSIIQGLIDGIMGMIGTVKDAVGNVLSAARNLLPFSPAKEGPFSGKGWTLYSGRSIVEALADGVNQRRGLFKDAVADAMALGQGQISVFDAPNVHARYSGINSSGLAGAFGASANMVNGPTFNVTAHDPYVAARVIHQQMRDMMGVMA